MDILLIFFGLIFIILGIIGAFVPVLPGPITSWIGLLLVYLTKAIEKDWTVLSITLVIAVIVYIIDYIIPAMGTKKFGGSKYGIWGSTIGLVVGMLFMGPLGIIIGPFLGALIGELMYDRQDSKRAFNAAIGSFIGFLFSTGLKFIVSLVYAGIFINLVWENWNSLF